MTGDDDDGVAAAIAGELRTLEVSVRQSPDQISALLHPDFFEFDPLGRRWDRRRTIEELAAQRPPQGHTAVGSVSEMTGVRLADDVVFLTYINESGGRRSRRSSVWRNTAGEWRLYFHQGTAISDPF